MSTARIEKLLRDIEKQRKRFFPEAPLLVLEYLPFYVKVRIKLKQELCIEVRNNAKNERYSYVLVKDRKRIAGFDNLGGWHWHPVENPNLHRMVPKPSLLEVFECFSDIVRKM